jgi:hypothetical protein
VRGKVQNWSALWPGQACRDGDEVAAQRRPAGDGVPVAGQRAGGAEQVWVIAVRIVHAAFEANWLEGR